MTRASRHPRTVAALCLALTLALSGGRAGAAQIDQYLPDDSDLVVSVNVRQAVGSEAFKRYGLAPMRAWMKSDPRVQLMALLGLDPLRDVERVTLAGPADPDALDEGLAIIHGNFDPPRIHAGADLLLKVSPDALAIATHQDVRVYRVRNKKQPDLATFAAFVDRNTLVLSRSEAEVLEAIDKSVGKKAPDIDANLEKLVAGQDDRLSLWLAAQPRELVRQGLAKNPRLRTSLENVRSVSGAVTLADDLRADFRIQTAGVRPGRQVREYLELARAVVVLALTSNEKFQDSAPLLAGILNTFRLTQDQGTVRMEARVSAPMLARWAQKKGLKDASGRPGQQRPAEPGNGGQGGENRD